MNNNDANGIDKYPSVSIIVPCYNQGKYIKECLDSIVNQTFKDYEVIIVDDCSTDNSLDIIKQYINNYNNSNNNDTFKLISHTTNKGVVTARNNAIAKAQGKYIYPLDADDKIDSSCLEKLYKAIENNKGDIITTRVGLFGEKTGEMYLHNPTTYHLANINCLVNSALFRKDDFNKVGGYDEAFNCGLEDYDLWLNMVIKNKLKIYKIPEILFFYRIKDKKESRNAIQTEQYRKTTKSNLLKKYPKLKLYRYLMKLQKLFFFTNLSYNTKEIKVFGYKFNLTRSKSVKLYYFNSASNFGDLLNIDLFNKLFNCNVIASGISKCNTIAIGSLLQMFLVPKLKIFKIIKGILKPPVTVYGTGFISQSNEDDNKVFCRKLDVRAVRGYNTLERLKQYKNVKIAENVAIGDLGLLAPYIYIDVSSVKKKYKLGIIPHYVDKNNPLLEKINVNNSIVLDITSQPSVLIKQIAECENIISSAMHGLIVADALGIPNIRMILSDKITGGDYKYDDYYSAFGIRQHNRINLNTSSFTEKDLEKMISTYQVKNEDVKKIQTNLLNIINNGE